VLEGGQALEVLSALPFFCTLQAFFFQDCRLLPLLLFIRDNSIIALFRLLLQIANIRLKYLFNFLFCFRKETLQS